MHQFGFFIGAVLVIWLLSAIFTFVQKLITKRVTRNIVVATTIIAGVLCLVSALFGEWEPGKAQTAYIAIIISTIVVTWSRLNAFKKKQETKTQITEEKKK